MPRRTRCRAAGGSRRTPRARRRRAGARPGGPGRASTRTARGTGPRRRPRPPRPPRCRGRSAAGRPRPAAGTGPRWRSGRSRGALLLRRGGVLDGRRAAAGLELAGRAALTQLGLEPREVVVDAALRGQLGELAVDVVLARR